MNVPQAQGVRLTERETRNGEVRTTTVTFDRTHLRVETGRTLVLLDAARQTAYTVNLDKKMYVEMNPDIADRLHKDTERLRNNILEADDAVRDRARHARAVVPRFQRARTILSV